MPLPRKSLISLSQTPYYHCVSRCVRRAFLCGKDKYTGQSYEHRRQWVEDRLLFLGTIFAIDICAYAVMSNHTHVVLHVDRQAACQWSTEQVLERWHRLHKGTVLTNRYLNLTERKGMSTAETDAVKSTAEIYRSRLHDISWFMRLLNEFIARQANKEDNCTGRFWEGRFKSQALLDEAALAACMAYVDLNPVRAGLATTPQGSCHTSIKKRLQAVKQNQQPRGLCPFAEADNPSASSPLPFLLQDYLALVNLTCGQFLPQKSSRGINSASILKNTGLSQAQWHWMVEGVEQQFGTRVSLDLVHKKFSHLNLKAI
ncbi:transposase [Salinimonas marina]|uniref:Transposase n=1 Tax=Salinimonas marina TaxID=2785918 RepID=A0A7S9DUV0_9ALTE|nr:transposase [Salinimonas marina]QPG04298.1 transposase [Salinimonas marina]